MGCFGHMCYQSHMLHSKDQMTGAGWTLEETALRVRYMSIDEGILHLPTPMMFDAQSSSSLIRPSATKYAPSWSRHRHTCS